MNTDNSDPESGGTEEPVVNGYVLLHRRGQLSCAIYRFDVLIDGEKVCKIKNNSLLKIPLKPGIHEFQVIFMRLKSNIVKVDIQPRSETKMSVKFHRTSVGQLFLRSDSAIKTEADEIDLLKQEHSWFVSLVSQGTKTFYSKKDVGKEIREKILQNELTKETPITVYKKSTPKEWKEESTTLLELTKDCFNLRVLYEPVWSHAITGLKWGALLGILLKLIDAVIMIGMIEPGYALLFVLAICMATIPNVGPVISVVGLLAMGRATGFSFLWTALGAILVGAVLGCLPGMGIGGIVGSIRKKRLPLASDAEPESEKILLKAVILPFAIGLLVFIIYICIQFMIL